MVKLNKEQVEVLTQKIYNDILKDRVKDVTSNEYKQALLRLKKCIIIQSKIRLLEEDFKKLSKSEYSKYSIVNSLNSSTNKYELQIVDITFSPMIMKTKIKNNLILSTIESNDLSSLIETVKNSLKND